MIVNQYRLQATPTKVPRSATQLGTDGPTHRHLPSVPEWARGGDSRGAVGRARGGLAWRSGEGRPGYPPRDYGYPNQGIKVPWSQRNKLLKIMEVVGPGGLEPPTKGL